MKFARFAVSSLALSLGMMSWLSIGAFAQHDHDATKPVVQKSDAQISFDSLKGLAGEWEGAVSVDPPQPQWDGINKPLHVTMRVTSRGNAIVHELQEANTPLDPTKYDHPVTLLYIDNDQLNLIHYCDAGNRPHMVARKSADGKTVEFDFADLTGPTKYGHMHHAVFTYVDANHHIEDWTYMMPGDKPLHAHFELKRVP
ncbi:MAG TPA: hypothetical protein VMT67_16795 [Terriglobales bacterium]|nr:hypothetical protein [Terriglobales bacterium]